MKPDLTQCDLEPITRFERIQSFGFLLAVSRDWIVTRASANLESMLGITAAAALGTLLDNLIDGEALHEIRNRMAILHLTRGTERLYGVTLTAQRAAFDVAVHLVGNVCVLEGEPTGVGDRMDAASMVRAMIARLGAVGELERFHRDAARQIQAMTGFSRVMIYQLEASGNGKVIAEAVQRASGSFLGLHFPGSDIPAQARALYLANPFRIIADVEAQTVPLLSPASESLEPLDLSLAITRAVSPVHIEYLRNMGVHASLSISIVVDGVLWGLIACHNDAARLPSFVVRTAAELFGQMYSMKLEGRLRQLSQADEGQAREQADQMLIAIEGDNSLLTRAAWLRESIGEMIDCDGVAVYIRGNLTLHGLTPPPAGVADIAERLNSQPGGRVFATDQLASLHNESIAHDGGAAGLLAIPISRAPRDYILLFRREQLQEIKWAGDPDKATSADADGMRISPRKSFAAFSESVRGRSRAFTERERRTAETIRVRLADFILRSVDGALDSSKPPSGNQDLLIAELNHRVRNVLSLIRGLISQSREDAGDVESYVKSLDERVQALARAHNRLTRHTWGPAPLAAIFDDEIAAYAPTRRGRFTVNGPAIFLQPQAFSTLALVIHELVTNSAKYGSLSGDGRVEVSLDHESGKGLTLSWRERGGPVVRLPMRRGFGSVLIERTVPFDLQGTATIRYAAAGFEADFFIPEHHLATETSSVVAAAPSPELVGDAVTARPLDDKRVLLLEDNLIVALEAEEFLLGFGARSVRMASSLAAAAQIFAAETFDFAMLDINLGVDTTLAFATRLRDANVPFIFASGYGQENRLGELHRTAVVVSKPYDRHALQLAITALFPEAKP